MIDASLHEIDFDKYQHLLPSCLGRAYTFAVYDSSAQRIWANCERGGQEFDHVTRRLDGTRRLWCGEVDHEKRVDIDDNRTVFLKSMAFETTTCVGYVALLVENASDVEAEDLLSKLRLIVRCIQDEYARVRELNAMSDELADRYEELNLLYNVEEKVAKYDPKEGREVLLHLVEDCAHHLGVDAVSLVMPGTKLEIHETTGESNALIPDLEELLIKLSKGSLSVLRENRESIVLNDANDPRWSRAVADKAPIKLVAAPILTVKSEVCGTLITLNHQRKLDFTNNDRRLVEVLAEQGSAVIQASHDTLTGLLNREGFESILKEALVSVQNTKENHAVLYLDLDQFKIVNDTSGYEAGDALLKQIAGLLQRTVGGTDRIARLGGDEFAIVLRRCSLDEAEHLAEQLLIMIKDIRFSWEGKIFDTKASIGVAAISSEIRSVEDLLSKADTACYIAKQRGRNRVHVYQADDAAYVQHHGEVQWIPRINWALKNDRFVLYAQPIAPLRSPEVAEMHYETLLRLVDEEGKLVPPFAFIPAAERYQLMPQIDRWVVRNVLARLSGLLSSDRCAPGIWTINLSGQSLSNEDFLQFLVTELEHSAVPSEWLCFEITETAVISNLNAAMDLITSLKERGCRFALDDFGSGLSSFTYLKNLPVDFLKIDGFFVKEMVTDPISSAMVESINNIGQLMGIRTIAEFVEDDTILARLAALGVDYAQGYGIGRPRPLEDELARLLGVTPVAAADP